MAFAALSLVTALGTACHSEKAVESCGGGNCDANLICYEGECRAPCNLDQDCPTQAEFCDSGVCFEQPNAECSQHSDCIAPGACQLSEGARCRIGRCEYEPQPDCCTADVDCPANFNTAATCDDVSTTTDCQGSGFIAACVGNTCSSVANGDDTPCEGLVHTCANNFAPWTCSGVADQPVATCKTLCTANSDCAPGFACIGDVCAPLAGLGDSCTGANMGTCGVGLQCSNSVCCGATLTTCCEDATPCPDGLACDTNAFACFESCNNYDDSTCADPTTYCFANACRAKLNDGVSCQSDGQCLNDRCVEGVCCGGACDQPCESCLSALTGQSDGTCSSIANITQDLDPADSCTATGWGCTGTSCSCDGLGSGLAHCKSTNGQSCTSDGDCSSGICECADDSCNNRKCASSWCGTCEFTTNGSLCQSGLGAAGAVDDDQDCTGNQSCYTGNCRLDIGQGCTTGSQCGAERCDCADAGCTLLHCTEVDCGPCRFASTGLVCDTNRDDSMSCDDTDACTHTDTCSGGNCAGTAYSCDDDNSCTDDICQGDSTCSFPPIGDGTLCDDQDACTDADACGGIVCSGDSVCVTFDDRSVFSGLDYADQAYGTSWADYDSDGYLDVWIAANYGTSSALFHNNGDGTFSLTGFAALGSPTRSGRWSDIDNDGDLDLMLMRGTSSVEGFYENDGAGAFVERAVAANLDGNNAGAAIILDHNGDGRTDFLFLNGNDPWIDVRLNDGAVPPTFSVVDTVALGLDPTTLDNGETAAAADVDNDGDLDIWYNGEIRGHLFFNNGDGTFTENAAGAGIVVDNLSDPYFGMAFGDYNGDGNLDLFLGRPTGEKNLLYDNNGDGTFTLAAALNIDLGRTRGMSWGDYDHDGNLDLVLANQNPANSLYHNEGDGTFTDVAVSLGFDIGPNATRSATFADYDNDGDLDIYFSNQSQANVLWRNSLNDDKFLKVRVVGRGDGFAPRDGIGSRIELWDGAATRLLAVREVTGGHGFGSQESNIVHFGLAAAWGGGNGTYTVKVRFADGSFHPPLSVVPKETTLTIGGTILANTLEVVQ